MGVQIAKIFNGNVYIDKQSYFGQFEEVTLPDITAAMADHKALGMIGKIELPAGLEKMEARIKFNGVYNQAVMNSVDFYGVHTLMIRSSRETYGPTGLQQQQTVVANLRGQFKKLSGFAFKPQDNVETETMFNVTAFELVIGGVQLFDIDVFAQVQIVNGVDTRALYRSALGI